MAKKKPGNADKKARKDRRIEELLDLVASGAYSGRRTEQALAAKWEKIDGEPVAINTVHTLAMEALRIHRLRYADDDEVRTRLLARIDAIGDKALARVRVERRKVRGGAGYEMVNFPDPDFKSALRAAELVGKEVGMFELKLKLMKHDNAANIETVLNTAEEVLGPEETSKLMQALASKLDQGVPDK